MNGCIDMWECLMAVFFALGFAALCGYPSPVWFFTAGAACFGAKLIWG